MPRLIRAAIVSDDPNFRRLLGDLLAHAGYQPLRGGSGPSSYRIIRHVRPALLLIDLRPDAPASWALLEQLLLDPVTAAIPLIICADDSAGLINLGSRLRAPDCAVLRKPIQLNALLAALSTTLGARQSVRRISPGAPVS